MSVDTIFEKKQDFAPAKLVVCEKKGTPQQFKLTKTICVGSSAEGSQTAEHEINDRLNLNYACLISDQGVFKVHDGTWSFINHAPIGTTTVNGTPLPANDEVTLQDGDVLRIENGTALIMIFLDHYQENAEWKTVSLNDHNEVIHIRCFESGGEEASVASQSAQPDNHHAQMRFVNGHWAVEDVCTDRGVYVNKEKVSGSRSLSEQDVICIGNTIFLYQENNLFYNHRTLVQNKQVIHIEERTVRELFKKHTLLKDINLTIDPGNMVLLLGGSGAGKTTFVNAVTGYEKAKAQIKEGNLDVYQDYDRMKYEIGFVPQQDLLREDDTVYMTLANAAEMRLPDDTPAPDRKKRVDEILTMFGLDTEKNELVGKLSGGQRKRLSIGVEFIADPSLFFLDEPDSGLDGVMARELMESLRKIADQNRIVLVITHTPDRVIDLFDKVIVLAKSTEDHVGHLAFYGPIDQARSFFGRDSMEEIVKAVNAVDEGGDGLSDQFIAKYKSLQEQETQQ